MGAKVLNQLRKWFSAASARPAFTVRTAEGTTPSRLSAERRAELREELRAKLKKDSVPYFDIPSIDGQTVLPEFIDPEEYKKSAESALRLARQYEQKDK